MKYIKDENCTVVYYSQVGSNHIKAGKENQDTVFFERLDKNRWYIAIADGVSSAAKSKQGSQAAVEVAYEICLMLKNEEWNLEDIKVDIVRKWKRKFSKDWNDYATTLNLLAYVDGKLLVGQIGDGLMVTNVDGEDEIYTEESDFYSTETDALAEAVRRKAITLTQKHISKKFYAYLMSDGIGKEVAVEERINLGKYLFGLMESSEADIKSEIISWINNLENKNGDDKTIGIIRWEE